MGNKAKAIILSGSVGAGKTTLLQQIQPIIPDFEIINPDKYLEDKTSPFHGNLVMSSLQVDVKDIPNAILNNKNFIWDTTASNPAKIIGGMNGRRRIPGLLHTPGYEIMMIMIYSHPIVSFLRNFERERKVPRIGVLKTWNNVYENIIEYKKHLGDRFVITLSPINGYERYVHDFEEALELEGMIANYFEEVVSEDPNKFSSTYLKSNKGLTQEEIIKKEKQAEKTHKQYIEEIIKLEKNFENINNLVEIISISKEEAITKLKRFINE
jgi:hypothetical protein